MSEVAMDALCIDFEMARRRVSASQSVRKPSNMSPTASFDGDTARSPRLHLRRMATPRARRDFISGGW
jgi:hypothetical protein